MLYANNDTKYVVATYKELILTFLIFCIILIVLYPKNMLKEQILAEKTNYDLSMLYLKNMLAHEPENETLMLALATQSLKTGKKDLADKLLELLHDSKNTKIRAKAYRESYILAKENYFYFEYMHNATKQMQYYRTLQKLFDVIVQNHYYTTEENDYLVKQALFVHDTKNAYRFILQIKDKKEQLKKLKELFYLTTQHKREDESFTYAQKLSTLESSEKEKWLDAMYHLLIKYDSKLNAREELERLAPNSHFWKEHLAGYYLNKKEYGKGANVYETLFYEEKNYKLQKTYFFKTLNSLFAAKELKRAIAFAKKYEKYYFKDKKVRSSILKYYLANGQLDAAAALSKKILRGRY